jgi:hypothetical protein
MQSRAIKRSYQLGGRVLSTGTLKTLLTRGELIEREEWTVVLKKLTNAVAPSAQPFRMMGKGVSARGSGPRFTDRKHYK